jgi:hypothetical protein
MLFDPGHNKIIVNIIFKDLCFVEQVKQYSQAGEYDQDTDPDVSWIKAVKYIIGYQGKEGIQRYIQQQKYKNRKLSGPGAKCPGSIYQGRKVFSQVQQDI